MTYKNPTRFHQLHTSKFGQRLVPKGVSIKSNVSNPAADFAYLNDMITDEEYEACKKGNMVIQGTRLLNLNARHPTIRTGEATTIFKDRKIRILGNRLLGLTDTD